MDWFEQITGFPEDSYHETQSRLQVKEGRLLHADGKRSWSVGALETPSLAELRARRPAAGCGGAGRLKVSLQQGLVQDLHAEPAHEGALFQAASQFNLLEMVHERITPEDGVTRYAQDATQGPACAIAAGAGTIYRNYLVPLDGGFDQTRDRQIDCLEELGRSIGNSDERLWEMSNGYAMFPSGAIDEIDARLERATPLQRDEWRGLLRIGVHRDVQVTLPAAGFGRHVTQAYCSALPVAYNSAAHLRSWARVATLVLEASYEATLLSAAENVDRGGSPKVFLTSVGGGVFGNDKEWIGAAMRRAFRRLAEHPLDVRIVTMKAPGLELAALVREFS